MYTWREDVAYQSPGKSGVKHSLAVSEKTRRLASACWEIWISHIGSSESSVIQDFLIKSVNLPLFNWSFEPEHASWDWTGNLQRAPSQMTESPQDLHLAAQLTQSITPQAADDWKYKKCVIMLSGLACTVLYFNREKSNLIRNTSLTLCNDETFFPWICGTNSKCRC